MASMSEVQNEWAEGINTQKDSVRGREGAPGFSFSSSPHLKSFENYLVELQAKRGGKLKLQHSKESKALIFPSLIPLY